MLCSRHIQRALSADCTGTWHQSPPACPAVSRSKLFRAPHEGKAGNREVLKQDLESAHLPLHNQSFFQQPSCLALQHSSAGTFTGGRVSLLARRARAREENNPTHITEITKPTLSHTKATQVQPKAESNSWSSVHLVFRSLGSSRFLFSDRTQESNDYFIVEIIESVFP